MTRLTLPEAERLLAALPDLYALGPVDAFPATALTVSRSLIGCTEASFNEIDLVHGGFKALVEPLDDRHEVLNEAFGLFLHQHPVVAHVARTGDSTPLAISDFLCPTDFHRLPLHGEFYGHLGIEDQLSTTFSAVPGQMVLALAIDRDGGFCERDRTMVAALQPHLAAAYANAVRFTKALAGAAGDPERTEDANARLGRLTDRQLELLELIACGSTNAQVAYILGLRLGTVKKHVEHILERLEVETRLAAACLYLTATSTAPPAPWWVVEGDMAAPRR